MNVIIHVVFNLSRAEFELMRKREGNAEKGPFLVREVDLSQPGVVYEFILDSLKGI